MRGGPGSEEVLDGAHGHGYLLLPLDTAGAAEHGGAPGHRTPADVDGWRVLDHVLPGARLRVHPRTVEAHHHGDAGAVVLLGHPVEVGSGSTDGAAVARGLAHTWHASGEQAMVREAALLGGRWTLLAGTADQLLVVPDTHATQPVFHARAEVGFAVASAPTLVAQALGLPVDDSALALLEELRSRRRGAVTYLPGRRTAYQGVDPLLPNFLLRITRTPPRTTHERFWPWRERAEVKDVGRVWAAFRDRLAEHTRLLSSLGRPAVSLTAGGDSRVTAAFARPWLLDRDGFTFTYVNPRDARRGPAALADVTGASAVAHQLGVPHRVLRWRNPPAAGTFDVLHRRTYAPLTPSRGAAHAMWADLPRDVVQLQSNCAETGTVFLRHRTDEPMSPLRLARMMMNATQGLEDLAEAMYGDYLDHAQLSRERLLGYDHHDVFYWEQRIGRWGYQKFVDGDLGHRVLLPFNDRVLIETMLSLPEEQRAAKVLFERVWTMEPRARLPQRTAGPTDLALRGAAHLPGPLRRTSDRVLQGVRRRTSGGLRLADGYAVLRTRAGGRSGAAPAVPPGWGRTALPDPAGTVLRHHPRLPHALVADERTGRWLVVLGRPVDLAGDRVGSQAVAAGLRAALLGTPDHEAALLAVRDAAAALAGRYVVLAGVRETWLAVADPLASLGLHEVEGGGLVSHAAMAPGRTRPLAPDRAVVGAGALAGSAAEVLPGTRPSGEAPTPGAEARLERIVRHVRLVAGRSPVRVVLPGGGAEDDGELLAVARALGGSALTWWDRLAPDEEADAVLDRSTAAFAAGVPHQVIGLREDVDGSAGEPGRARRALAVSALRTTWGPDQVDAVGDGPAALSAALDQALEPGVVLVLGAPPPAGPGLADRPWDLVQGVRPVALPLSDRAL